MHILSFTFLLVRCQCQDVLAEASHLHGLTQIPLNRHALKQVYGSVCMNLMASQSVATHVSGICSDLLKDETECVKSHS